MRRLWKTKLPAFLLAMVMVIGMIPAAGAASADIERTVEAGDEVTFKASAFKSLFNDEYPRETFSYVEFKDAGDLDDYGYFTAYDYYEDQEKLYEDDLENSAYFYYDSNDVPKNYDYELSGLTFVADDGAKSGTLKMKFVLVGEDSDYTVNGTLEIEIDGNGSSSDTISLKKITPAPPAVCVT